MNSFSLTLRDADEIEAFYVDMAGMKPGYLQLSTGLVDLKFRIDEFAGVTLVWSRAQGRSRWRDEMTGEALHIGFAIESTGPIVVRGRDFDIDVAQIWMPGKEMDYLLSGPYLTLEIGVEAHLIEELGWEFNGDPLATVPQECLSRLTQICQRASSAIGEKALGAVGSSSPSETEHWRDQVLEALEPALQPWLSDPGAQGATLFSSTRSYRLIRQADDFLDSLGDDAPFEVDRLAASLGVPRRTLFYAYRKLLGIGPRRYFELKRLQKLRTRLKQASPSDATVAIVASDLGFRDLGRLAANYKKRFGEYPYETLKRAP